ncbi:10176_t:CDS:2 [Rhizophagus irregularis]|nr:10176_t:CDS:2 [Rhizophagus irregularis]
MPKKFRGENTKVTAAKEKKAVHQKEVNSKKQAEKERKESEEWSVGAKDTSKKEAQRLRKPVIKLTKKSGEETKAIKKTQKVEQEATERREIPEFSASNIDDALDLLENNGGGAPTSASNIERHPERRFKAAFRAYEEHEMPKLRKENPGLRYAQLHNLLYENFKKSPENPFNQTNVLRYNASKNEEIDLIETTRKNIEDRLRV